jgi:CRP-like cAMP-binding protein
MGGSARNAWDLFTGLPSSQVDAILALSELRAAPKGAVLFDLGDQALEIFLVERGLVRLTLPLTMGNQRLDTLVGERASGHMVGWSGLIPPHRFTVKAAAAEDTLVRSLPRSSLGPFLDANPDTAKRVYLNLAQIVGQRLQVFQALWIREMQHVVKTKTS